MSNVEYYKSLISDEEVIKALIKESKAREVEMLKEKTRVRPNLNFFQRTVSNLVSSNKRISSTKESANKETERQVSKVRGKIKTPHTLIKEIVTSNKIDFAKARDNKTASEETIQRTECMQALKLNVSSSTDSLNHEEKKCKEDMHKYFVYASENSNKTMQNCNFSIKNKTKSKSIVFNFNFNKGKLVTKPSTAPKKVLVNNRKKLCLKKSSDNSVINISSSSSSSDENDVIEISESD